MSKRILYILSVLIIASMVLAACAQPATEAPAVEEPAAEEPAAEEPAAESFVSREQTRIRLRASLSGYHRFPATPVLFLHIR